MVQNAQFKSQCQHIWGILGVYKGYRLFHFIESAISECPKLGILAEITKSAQLLAFRNGTFRNGTQFRGFGPNSMWSVVPMTSKTTIFGCILRILMLRILATLTVSCCTDICEYFLSWNFLQFKSACQIMLYKVLILTFACFIVQRWGPDPDLEPLSAKLQAAYQS